MMRDVQASMVGYADAVGLESAATGVQNIQRHAGERDEASESESESDEEETNSERRSSAHALRKKKRPESPSYQQQGQGSVATVVYSAVGTVGQQYGGPSYVPVPPGYNAPVPPGYIPGPPQPPGYNQPPPPPGYIQPPPSIYKQPNPQPPQIYGTNNWGPEQPNYSQNTDTFPVPTPPAYSGNQPTDYQSSSDGYPTGQPTDYQAAAANTYSAAQPNDYQALPNAYPVVQPADSAYPVAQPADSAYPVAQPADFQQASSSVYPTARLAEFQQASPVYPTGQPAEYPTASPAQQLQVSDYFAFSVRPTNNLLARQPMFAPTGGPAMAPRRGKQPPPCLHPPPPPLMGRGLPLPPHPRCTTRPPAPCAAPPVAARPTRRPPAVISDVLPRRPEQAARAPGAGLATEKVQDARGASAWGAGRDDDGDGDWNAAALATMGHVGAFGATTTARNRPELGVTASAESSSHSVSPTKEAEMDEDFNIHATSSSQEAGGFSDTQDEWARLIQPVRTADLPALLGATHAAPVLLPAATETGAQHLDPIRENSAEDGYPAPEFDALGGAADAPERIAEDVWAVVESLTAEEKAGQMQQIHVSQLLDPAGRLNMTAVGHWIGAIKVGSIVDTPGNAGGAYEWYSAATLANLTDAVQQVALAQGARVPVLWGLDSVRGASFVRRAAMFPVGVGLAAGFDPRHAWAAARVAAKDSRAAGFRLAFAPSADLGVDKRRARAFLGFGEDPALAAAMVRAAVRGLQGAYHSDSSRVAACVRSFIDGAATHVSDRHLLEYHVPAFAAAVDAGAAAVMQSADSVGGEAVAASGFYLRRLLRDRLKFRGVMLADKDAILAQARALHSAANFTDAVYLALNNTSIDVSASGSAPVFFAHAAAALVRAGAVPEDRLTESAARIVQLKKDLGLFAAPYADRHLQATVGSAQDIKSAQDAVRESVTLLKNAGHVLPLSPADRVLFVGPHMNSTALLGGGWNVHRGGPRSDAVYEGAGESILQGVRRLTGAAPVFHPGFRLASGEPVDPESLITLARQADKIVVALGEAPYAGAAETRGDLALDAGQIDLVVRLAALGRPVVALLVEGRPRLLKDAASAAAAVLTAYLPGIHAGGPIAEVLYGRAAPSGRLPFTYPRYEFQSRDTAWQGLHNEYSPQWPFGFGLGYSRLDYSNITVDSTDLRPGKPISVSLSIRNDGALEQREPVLLYTTQSFRTGYEPELFRLRRFDKVSIKPGNAAVVQFTLTAEELAYYNRDLVRVIDTSPVNITINAMTPNERTITINLSA
ncbi:hypothetical protein GGI02_002664 [Coemansia sp. RSA 2322]|nr:hypothetical protein GGI02_002664 [Coemansia sp. RSA 2322]